MTAAIGGCRFDGRGCGAMKPRDRRCRSAARPADGSHGGRRGEPGRSIGDDALAGVATVSLEELADPVDRRRQSRLRRLPRSRRPLPAPTAGLDVAIGFAPAGVPGSLVVRVRRLDPSLGHPQVAKRPVVGREQESTSGWPPRGRHRGCRGSGCRSCGTGPCPRASCTARRAARWAPSGCRIPPGRPCRSRRCWGGRSASASGSRGSFRG